MKPELTFHALVKKDKKSSKYLAVCLELYIITEGKTLQEAEKGLRDAVDMYVEDVLQEKDYESLYRPAPREYWEEFFKTKPNVHLISA